MSQLVKTRGRHVRNPRTHGSGVPGGTHPNFKNMGSGGFRIPGKVGQRGFRWVPGSRQIGPKWVPGSRSEPEKWVPGVPGSRSEPKKWVPMGY